MPRTTDPHLEILDSPLDQAVTQRDGDVLAMVAEALRAGRVAMAYQPVVQAQRPDRIAFHEGLVRVLDPTGRVIPARDFIGAVEATDIGRRIDCVALSKGLDALEETPGLRLAVNMSARSIGYAPWLRVLDRGLARDPSIGERLILEITESSAMLVPELVTDFMRRQQEKGLCFALDDFGAGATSFRYLRDFFFDLVKIDAGFVRGVARSADNQVLCQVLQSIARHFDMFTVAEAVESPEDADWLAAAGIDCLQGYLFGAPSIAPPWQGEAARRRPN
ncbi:EAL domain-containing protein [Frigidibacter sp. MR17.14]|uniref:EAL domain-containing protein n=1 Tax=Frigidibacter sp. MR17.14 TaxID=3126509 RepID=UPI003012FE31